MTVKPLAPSDVMSLTRTVLSIDRSLMAWVRTALSLIGFGFTIFSFLDSMVAKGSVAISENGPRHAGMILIGLGTGSLILGMLQYWKEIRHFSATYGISPWRVSLGTGLVVAAIGGLLLVLISTGGL